MAQPVNSFDSYDIVGKREDLSDIIYDISPDETPFYSMCAKTRAKNTFHEWQTDALRSSATNAHIEGDDTVAEARTATTRLGNYTQIFKNAVVIPGTDDGIDKAGRGKEMDYQTVKIGKEQKLDIEKALFSNTARSAGSGVAARFLAGAPTWLTTNTVFGSGGADATGDGTNTRTDGTQAALTQTMFDSVMQQRWQSGGGDNVTVFLSAYQMNLALGFVGNNNQRSNLSAGSAQVVKNLDVYITPWGRAEFMPTRENRARDMFLMQKDMWAVAVLRPTFSEPLAKSGDSDKKQVITELTLVPKNEKASGGIFDLTTS